jgi:hypothetical protein
LRNIGSRWRNLADGLLRIETLEAHLLTVWGQRLDKAHKERPEAARQRTLRRGRATLISALVVAILMLTLSLVLLRLASPAATIVLRLTFLLPTVLAICGVLFLLRSPDPTRVRINLRDVWWHIIPKHGASIRRSGSTLAPRRYGDQGEESFVSYLSGVLSKEYVTVMDLLVAQNLDADVIVVDPTGFWIY